MRAAALLALAACHHTSGGTPDAAGAADASADSNLADVAACEADLATQWAATPPSTGLATAAARGAYEPIFRLLMSEYQIPGMSVSVTKNGVLVAALGIGMNDPTALQLAHPDDRWRLASLSKQITATAILHLVEDGSLSLDDHPFQILSDLQPFGGATRNPMLASITVRQLLQHLGGWNRSSEAVGDPMFASQTISAAAGIAGPADPTSIVRYMLDKPLTYAPGTTMCYSNFGYTVLGLVIERVSGVPYDQYVKGHVLQPVGATEMLEGKTQLADRADGEVAYVGYPGEPLATSVFPNVTGQVPWEYGGFYLEAMAAHGAWLASTVDMERFAVSIDGKATVADQLAPSSEAAMIADPHVPSCTNAGGTTPEDPSYWYGFGLAANSYGNLWHTGSLPGTTTEDVIAGNGFTWSIFTNTRTATAGEPDSAIDQHGWDPINSVTDWGTRDLFDQYPAFSAWMPESAFDAAMTAATGAGKYPTRLEARLGAGGVELRARFAPLPAGVTPDVGTGLDCPAYVARDTAATSAGRARVSLQSYVAADGTRRYQAVWATPY
jgi:N-acyl-D-amino-acid deacylase